MRVSIFERTHGRDITTPYAKISQISKHKWWWLTWSLLSLRPATTVVSLWLGCGGAQWVRVWPQFSSSSRSANFSFFLWLAWTLSRSPCIMSRSTPSLTLCHPCLTSQYCIGPRKMLHADLATSLRDDNIPPPVAEPETKHRGGQTCQIC